MRQFTLFAALFILIGMSGCADSITSPAEPMTEAEVEEAAAAHKQYMAETYGITYEEADPVRLEAARDEALAEAAELYAAHSAQKGGGGGGVTITNKGSSATILSNSSMGLKRVRLSAFTSGYGTGVGGLVVVDNDYFQAGATGPSGCGVTPTQTGSDFNTSPGIQTGPLYTSAEETPNYVATWVIKFKIVAEHSSESEGYADDFYTTSDTACH